MYHRVVFSLFGEYFGVMSNSSQVAAKLDGLRKEQGRSVLWLHRKTALPYKSLLNQLKGRRPLTLEYACASAKALNVELQELVAS